MIGTQRCTQPPNISAKTVKASFEENSTTWAFLDSLDESKWRVTSFDPRNRLVCIELDSCCGLTHYLTFTIPIQSNTTRYASYH